MTEHTLGAERLHFAWDNSLAPVLEVEPGDTVTISTWDASGHFYTPASTSADVLKPKPHPGHALTGPIPVHGARAGGTLVVEVLEVNPAAHQPGRRRPQLDGDRVHPPGGVEHRRRLDAPTLAAPAVANRPPLRGSAGSDEEIPGEVSWVPLFTGLRRFRASTGSERSEAGET